MKKLLGILTVVALASSAFAQGTITLANSSTTAVKQWTSTSDSTAVVVGKGTAAAPAGFVQFFAADAGLTLAKPLFTPSSLTPTAPLFANYTTLSAFLADNTGWQVYTPTRFLSLAGGNFNGGTVTVTGVTPAGDQASYFAIGWTGNFASFDGAMQAALLPGSTVMMNITPVITTATGNPLLTPPGAAISIAGTFPSTLTLAPVVVPEPTTFALAGLGVAALLVFRRRK